MPDIEIKFIFNKNGKLYVKPAQGTYEFVYRAAMSVGWDESINCLVYTGVDTDDSKKINIIKKAVYNEYGVNLITTDNTIFKDNKRSVC